MKHAEPRVPLTAHLAALAEPLRLRIVRLLEQAELSVGEVGKVIQLPQSTVSRHLRVLSDAGWTLRRNEGTATLYRVVLDDLPHASRALWLAVRESLTQDDLGSELAHDDRRLVSVLSERREDSRAFFGRVAGQWDDVRTELFGARFTALSLLSLVHPESVVADIGCGTGNASELLAPFVRSVIAIDQSPPMIEAAQTRLKHYTNVEFRQGEVESLPLANGEVDIVVCLLILHHVSEPDAACRELKRVIKPGGVVLFVDMIEHDRATYRHTMGHRWLGFSKDQMLGYMQAAGLCNIRYVLMPSDPDARGPSLFACTGYSGHADQSVRATLVEN